MTIILYIGNKNYSSWSMRPWLALSWAGIAFEERLIQLGGPGYGASKMPAVLAISPSGRVPALDVDGLAIWDSLAIAEWAVERAPASRLLPSDPSARAVCRSVVCEMHAGFSALRSALPMNIRRRAEPRAWSEEVRSDIARIEDLWSATRDRFGAGGPFLFGARTIADAFFAPVATRFRTYGVSMRATSRAYCEAIFADDAFRAWEDAAKVEPWTMPMWDAT